MKKLLYLIDGSHYIFRYYFGIPMVYSSDGMPVNVLYGYCHMLSRLMTDKNDQVLAKLLALSETEFKQYKKYITIAFDSGSKESFRQGIYANYKANRVQAPSELRIQYQHLIQVLQTFQIRNISIPNFEADDIIASYTSIALQQGFNYIIILACDKDMMQLVSDRVLVYDTFKNNLYNQAMVYNKFHVYPQQIIDYLALIGDNSDNIPGIPGIGPKTAVKFLAEYQSIDNMLIHISKIQPIRHQLTLLQHQENIQMSKKLIKLYDQITLPDINDLSMLTPDPKDLLSLYNKYNIKLRMSL